MQFNKYIINCKNYLLKN